MSLSSGASVTIPQGSLAEPTEIALAERDMEELQPLPSAVDALGKPVAMTPHGTRFEKKVEVELPLSDGSGFAEGELRVLRLDDESDTTWEDAGAARSAAEAAVFTTQQFSIYVLVRATTLWQTAAVFRRLCDLSDAHGCFEQQEGTVQDCYAAFDSDSASEDPGACAMEELALGTCAADNYEVLYTSLQCNVISLGDHGLQQDDPCHQELAEKEACREKLR